MEDWHFWVPIGISLAAAALSAASWWHNLSAHHERRSGEIIRLCSGVLQRLALVQKRLREADQGLRSSRFHLGNLPDSDENKYDWIEKASALAKDADKYVEKAQSLRLTIDGLPGTNSARILRELQISEHEVAVLEHGADRLTQIAEQQTEAINQNKRREDAEREARYEELTR